MIDYTLVIGVDERHLEQLSYTWPTWRRHKPLILEHPMVVFFDHHRVNRSQVRSVVDHPDLRLVGWPNHDQGYEGGDDKWTDPQRYKMLAGFVHIPAIYVDTSYWLKLDTDVVATGCDDWVDDGWFEGDPAIVAQPWSFTKPADQMLKLDKWVYENRETLWFNEEPLNLAPKEGSDRVGHKRIISWCGFFRSEFTTQASNWAEITCGRGMLPVPSQDGYLWYCAARLKYLVKRVQMKKLGFEHWSTMFNVRQAAERAMA